MCPDNAISLIIFWVQFIGVQPLMINHLIKDHCLCIMICWNPSINKCTVGSKSANVSRQNSFNAGEELIVFYSNVFRGFLRRPLAYYYCLQFQSWLWEFNQATHNLQALRSIALMSGYTVGVWIRVSVCVWEIRGERGRERRERWERERATHNLPGVETNSSSVWLYSGCVN